MAGFRWTMRSAECDGERFSFRRRASVAAPIDRDSGGLQDRALRRSAALNTHRSAATKFTATITPTASALAGIGGNPNAPANRAIKAALPAMEATPLAS